MNVTRELVTTTVIASNTVWKYFDGGVSQGTSWVSFETLKLPVASCPVGRTLVWMSLSRLASRQP